MERRSSSTRIPSASTSRRVRSGAQRIGSAARRPSSVAGGGGGGRGAGAGGGGGGGGARCRGGVHRGSRGPGSAPVSWPPSRGLNEDRRRLQSAPGAREPARS